MIRRIKEVLESSAEALGDPARESAEELAERHSRTTVAALRSAAALLDLVGAQGAQCLWFRSQVLVLG